MVKIVTSAQSFKEAVHLQMEKAKAYAPSMETPSRTEQALEQASLAQKALFKAVDQAELARGKYCQSLGLDESQLDLSELLGDPASNREQRIQELEKEITTFKSRLSSDPKAATTLETDLKKLRLSAEAKHRLNDGALGFEGEANLTALQDLGYLTYDWSAEGELVNERNKLIQTYNALLTQALAENPESVASGAQAVRQGQSKLRDAKLKLLEDFHKELETLGFTEKRHHNEHIEFASMSSAVSIPVIEKGELRYLDYTDLHVERLEAVDFSAPQAKDEINQVLQGMEKALQNALSIETVDAYIRLYTLVECHQRLVRTGQNLQTVLDIANALEISNLIKKPLTLDNLNEELGNIAYLVFSDKVLKKGDFRQKLQRGAEEVIETAISLHGKSLFASSDAKKKKVHERIDRTIFDYTKRLIGLNAEDVSTEVKAYTEIEVFSGTRRTRNIMKKLGSDKRFFVTLCDEGETAKLTFSSLRDASVFALVDGQQQVISALQQKAVSAHQDLKSKLYEALNEVERDDQPFTLEELFETLLKRCEVAHARVVGEVETYQENLARLQVLKKGAELTAHENEVLILNRISILTATEDQAKSDELKSLQIEIDALETKYHFKKLELNHFVREAQPQTKADQYRIEAQVEEKKAELDQLRASLRTLRSKQSSVRSEQVDIEVKQLAAAKDLAQVHAYRNLLILTQEELLKVLQEDSKASFNLDLEKSLLSSQSEFDLEDNEYLSTEFKKSLLRDLERLKTEVIARLLVNLAPVSNQRAAEFEELNKLKVTHEKLDSERVGLEEKMARVHRIAQTHLESAESTPQNKIDVANTRIEQLKAEIKQVKALIENAEIVENLEGFKDLDEEAKLEHRSKKVGLHGIIASHEAEIQSQNALIAVQDEEIQNSERRFKAQIDEDLKSYLPEHAQKIDELAVNHAQAAFLSQRQQKHRQGIRQLNSLLSRVDFDIDQVEGTSKEQLRALKMNDLDTAQIENVSLRSLIQANSRQQGIVKAIKEVEEIDQKLVNEWMPTLKKLVEELPESKERGERLVHLTYLLESSVNIAEASEKTLYEILSDQEIAQLIHLMRDLLNEQVGLDALSEEMTKAQARFKRLESKYEMEKDELVYAQLESQANQGHIDQLDQELDQAQAAINKLEADIQKLQAKEKSITRQIALIEGLKNSDLLEQKKAMQRTLQSVIQNLKKQDVQDQDALREAERKLYALAADIRKDDKLLASIGDLDASLASERDKQSGVEAQIKILTEQVKQAKEEYNARVAVRQHIFEVAQIHAEKAVAISQSLKDNQVKIEAMIAEAKEDFEQKIKSFEEAQMQNNQTALQLFGISSDAAILIKEERVLKGILKKSNSFGKKLKTTFLEAPQVDEIELVGRRSTADYIRNDREKKLKNREEVKKNGIKPADGANTELSTSELEKSTRRENPEDSKRARVHALDLENRGVVHLKGVKLLGLLRKKYTRRKALSSLILKEQNSTVKKELEKQLEALEEQILELEAQSTIIQQNLRLLDKQGKRKFTIEV